MTHNTHAVTRFFRLKSDRECLYLLLLATVLAVTLYTQLYALAMQFGYDVKRLDFHESVIHGTAPYPGQYQCYLHDTIMQAVFRFLPHKAGWFNLVYASYYGAGAIAFVLLLFRLSLRVASAPAAALACTFLAALYPIFLWDNWYHPQDTWGCLLAVLIMEALLDGKRGRYFLLLFLSGFVWEKHYLVPICVGLYDFWQSRKLIRTALMTGLAAILSVCGQLTPFLLWGVSFLAHSSRPTDQNPSFWENIPQLPLYFAGTLILYGIQIWSTTHEPAKVPGLFKVMLLQVPAFFLIMMVLHGNIREMRSTMIMIPLTWPMVAAYLDRQLFSGLAVQVVAHELDRRSVGVSL